MFTDQVSLTVQAGRGGDGIVAWRREKYIPKGGPAGGDGGKGGSILLQADSQLLSLENLRNIKTIKAENGKPGGAKNQKGRNGFDKTIKVPCGTLIKNSSTNEILFDLKEDGQTITLCNGGKGGKGNRAFKSPTRRAPYICTQGKLGEELEVKLELKLIANIGLIGMPNAGKSTLMTQLTHAQVKIAPYPFTTLTPNLGVLEFEDFTKTLIADIPGILSDAHKNKGLGISFLKHIERTSFLLYVIDISSEDAIEDFKTLQNELLKYSEEMIKKPSLIVLNKIDIEDVNVKAKDFKKKFSKKFKIFEISALKNINIKELKDLLYRVKTSISF